MSRPIFESTNHPLRRNRQRIRKIPLKSTISEGFWSEWRDSNARLPHPKCGALPTGLHPDIQFLSLYHGGEENQRFFCLWSFMWSKPLLCRFRQEEEIPQTQALQGFEAFRLTLSRIQPRHSQTTRATNCANPGYSIFCMIPCREGKSKFFVSVGGAVVKPDFSEVFQPGNFHRNLLSQGLPGFRFWGNG